MSLNVDPSGAPDELSLLGGPDPLPQKLIAERLASLREHLEERAQKLLGYQANQDWVSGSVLAPV